VSGRPAGRRSSPAPPAPDSASIDPLESAHDRRARHLEIAVSMTGETSTPAAEASADGKLQGPVEGEARFIEEDFSVPFFPTHRRASRASTFALCLALLTASVLLLGRHAWLAGFAGALGLLFGFLGIWHTAGPRYLARQFIRGLNEDEFPVRFRFDQDGMTISGTWGSSFYRYSGIHSYTEHRSKILVQTGPVLRTVVPKRAFSSADLEIVQALLRSRVKPRATSAEPSGASLTVRYVALWVAIVLLLLVAMGVIDVGGGP
jgi:hypothetical protein